MAKAQCGHATSNITKMKRHSFPSGTLVVFPGTKKSPKFIPAWCPMISADFSRHEAAKALKQLRSRI